MFPYRSSPDYFQIPHFACFGYSVPNSLTPPSSSGDNVTPQVNNACFTKSTISNNVWDTLIQVLQIITHGAPPPHGSKQYKVNVQYELVMWYIHRYY